MTDFIGPLDSTRDAWMQALKDMRMKEEQAWEQVQFFNERAELCIERLEDLGVDVTREIPWRLLNGLS
jgi:hypothetical protein